MRYWLVALIFAVPACGDRSPPRPTDEQARQLNEADAMLNDLAQNDEGPEANGDPSK